MSPVDFGSFEAMTFDTYGTLIDWEAGILAALAPAVRAGGIETSDDELLETYARHEAAVEAGDYLRYAEVLGRAFVGVCVELGVSPSSADVAAFSRSVGEWPAFWDSAEALAVLKRRFRLGVITNCDDDLFALSNDRLGVEFDWVITAEQAGSYKPSRRNFELAFERIGVPRERIVHVAQSLFHDHVPAKALGLTTVWVDRRGGGGGSRVGVGGRKGFGATPPAEAVADLVVPDLRTLGELVAAGGLHERR